MTLVVLGIVSIVACYKFGDLKNWEKYYSTILFYNIGALTENIITRNKPLWLFYGTHLTDTIADYVFGFLIFPCIIIVYLSNYPKAKIKQVLYTFAFISFMSLVELILYGINDLQYYNGWNVSWSILLYVGVFPLLQLHLKKPLLALLVLFILTIGGLIYFKVPIIN
ncbi:MAG: hypothetical protein KID04_16235 [Clostridium sp.]|nr:hypothetical protein [Clostridium sp.]